MSSQIGELETRELVTAGVGCAAPLGKILVVDDEPELKTILVDLLQRHGYQVTGCSSGPDALAVLQEQDFDLLVTDLMMPEMDGISLLKAAQEIDSHLMGIVLTGQGTIKTAVDAMQLGAFDYMLKPFRLQNLLPVLTRALNTRQLRLENLQLRETVAIHELCQTIAFTLDPQTVMSKLTEAALQQTEADEVSVLLPTSDGKEFYVAAARGPQTNRLLGERIPFDRSIASWVARERTPVILNGEVHDDRFVALWPRPDIRSSVSIPMVVANKLVGVLNLNVTNQGRPFALGQMKALSILAGTAATALESASLYTQVRTTEEKYRSIFENATEGLFQTSPGGQLLTANPALSRILGYDSPEEMVATINDIAHQLYVNPEDRAEAGRLQKESGRLERFEVEAKKKGGERIWLSLNRRSIRNQKGELLHFEGSVEDITQRKRSEAERAKLTAEIESQRQRLNNIVATVPGIVWEAWGRPDEINQRIDFVSDYVETMLGYSVDEWLSTPNFWLSIVHPDDKEHAARLAGEAFASGKAATMEFRWLAKDDRQIWIESNFVVVLDERGQPAGLRGVNTDISERKRAEAALKQSESQLAEAQRLAHIGSWNWDLRKNELTWSEEHYHIFGLERGEFEVNYDDAISQFIHPEDQALVRSEVARTIETKEPFAIHYRVVRRDGEERVIQSTGNLESDEQGQPTRLFGTAQDVTEGERISRQLSQSEERYRNLVENAHDLIYEHDLEGNYTATNQAAEQMTGYTVAESLKLSLLSTVAPDYLEKAKDMLRRKLAGESVTAYELVIITKDGRRVPVEVNTRLVLKDGIPVGVQGIARDITGRKRVEEIQARRSAHVLFRADVSAALAISGASLRATLESCVTAMVHHLGAAFARIWTLNPEEEMLVLQASAGMYTHLDGPHARVPVGSFKIGKIAEERVPHITNNVQSDRRVSDKKWARTEGMTAFAGYPLLLEDRLLGVMALFSRTELPEDTLDALASVADLISHGIERRQTEEALLESEARKRAILESSMDAIITIDQEGLVVDWNPAAEKTFGYSHTEAAGRNMSELIVPLRYREQHTRGMARYLATGEGRMLGQRLELSAQRSDGSEFPIELTITQLVLEGVHLFTGYLRDITERNKARARLAAQYAVTTAIAEANTVAEGAARILQTVCEGLGWEYGSLWLVDRSLNVLRCSQVWQAPGTEADEFEGASRDSVFAPGMGLPGRVWNNKEALWVADLAKDLKFPRAAVAAKVGLHCGCGFPVRLGSEILGVVEFFGCSVRAHEPEMLAMMATIGSQIGQFIERKRVEEALGESEEQLRQSQKLEAIGQLAGGVAHDFNNLLTVIGGYSSILLGKVTQNSPHRSSLEEIKKASDRASALTRQLLAFSRKQILQPKVLDLNTVVSDLDKMVRRLIGEDIDLLTVTDPDLGKVKADPGQIDQVLLNLIVNARDAMPGGGKLTIETSNAVLSPDYAQRHAAIPGPYVLLAVSDTGCGMDARTLDRIFEPFFTTKGAGKGTGLGLATVYGIVKQSGGSIWVYSEVGRGSVFKIYLPRVDEVALGEESGRLKVTPLGTETVLVVEDDDQVRLILTQILEGQGYCVLSASNGDEALLIARDRECDIKLMITDVVMPQMSGRELTEQVLTIRPELPILFMSGYTDDAIVRHGLLDEKLNFIQKPFDAATVARKVRDVLDLGHDPETIG